MVIKGVGSYYAGMVNGVSAQVHAQLSSFGTGDTGTDRQEKVKPADGNSSLRPATFGASMAITAAGSVVYEAGSLLANLSSAGQPQGLSEPPQRAPGVKGYGCFSSGPSDAGEEPHDEPVTYTFETTV